MVRLVKDQQRARPEIAEKVTKASGINFIGDQRMRQEEERARRPWVHGKAALAPHSREILAIDDCECEPELSLELILPLTSHRRRRGDHDEIDATPKDQFTKDQAGFNSFAGAHVIRNQKIDAGQRERLGEWNQLIRIEMDAGSERRLQQLSVGRGRSGPTNRAQIGGKYLRIVRPRTVEHR